VASVTDVLEDKNTILMKNTKLLLSSIINMTKNTSLWCPDLTPASSYAPVLALCGEVLIPGGLQGSLLCEAAGSFPHVRQSQCQPAPRQTRRWQRLSPSATVVAPLG